MQNNPFQSFWMAGYECSDKLNVNRQRVDFLNITGHLEKIDEDYQLLKPFNIQTVREGIRWSFVETAPYQYDWAVVKRMLIGGKNNNIQQIWDICHFGFPDDLTPFDAEFTPRFVALCQAFVRIYRAERPDDVLIVTPINEVSYLSWLGGETCGTSPYCRERGWDVKYHLMKAYIAGVAAMRDIDPDIRILTTEPLVNMVPPLHATPEDIAQAAFENEIQFQAVDMLCGRMCPELGGKPEYADLLGFNYYYNNQWIVGQQGFLPWYNEKNDDRFKHLSELLLLAYQRYNRPIVITETSHSGEHRFAWLEMVAEQCATLLELEVPLLGVCLYPIIDRPDWNDLACWHHSGLWDHLSSDNTDIQRIIDEPYARKLLKSQQMLENTKAQLYSRALF